MNILISIIGSVVVFTIVLGFAVYSRYLQHKETLALAEKGLLKDESVEKGKAIFRWGLIFNALGLILILVMIPFAWNNIWVLFLLGLLPLAMGVGLLIIFVLMQESPLKAKPVKKAK